jgi:hypothetical protein
VVAWPLALVALVVAPLVLLIAIPFGIIGVVFSALLALIEAFFMCLHAFWATARATSRPPSLGREARACSVQSAFFPGGLKTDVRFAGSDSDPGARL